ncbi:MAG TPA: signal peptide peptidase SppA [candidate division Zixibacteria bacterium]|nr:signal peptide peptidase SppA [candidate division Zixibacteria bacterium]HEQ99272.1 signal peptide peptidase SppA [candidate division Zixibacteria bacterium]
MKKAIAVLIILWLLPACLASERYPYPYYPLPEYSGAVTFGTLSIFQNPAALGINPDMELMYLHSFNSDRFSGDNSILFSRNGLGLAYQNYRLSVDDAMNAFTIGFSGHISQGIYAGATYKFIKAEDGNPYHNDHFWNLGLLWRYSREISLGFVAENLKGMEFAGEETDIEYKLSAGFRPLQELLTLSADWSWSGGEAFSDGVFRGFFNLKIKEGIGILGSVDEDGNFGFGVNFSFGYNQIGTYHTYTNGGHDWSGLLYSGYSYRPQGWVFPVKKKFLKLTLSGSYPETGEKDFFLAPERTTFLDLVQTLNRALDDEIISGIYVELRNPRLGWAQIKELRTLFHSFRNKGKAVLFYLGHLPGNASYYLAASADKIAMHRVDDLAITGLLGEVTFYKGTLDKLGIEADIYAAGKYKSAADILTRDSMSRHHREAVNKLLDDIFEQYVNDLAFDRDLTRDSVISLIDNAPHVSEEAVQAGLVDTILYQDQIPDWQKSRFGSSCSIDFEEYSKRKPYRERWGLPPQIAVIPVEGTLMSGSSGEIPFYGKTTGSKDLAMAIEYARKNSRIRAVVLRLNTPGGDGLASDLLHRELELLSKEKPLIVSMGNVAASAGYHLASAGDYIYAQPSTVTGSIGVVYGKLDLSDLRENIGFTTYHLKRGKNADFFSWNTGFTEQQEQKLQRQLDLMYEDFVQIVAEGRDLSYDYVESVAQGRVWSGSAARELKLVDDYGGLWDALHDAKERAGISDDEVEIVSFPKRPFRFLDLWSGLSSAAKTIKSLMFGNGILSDTANDSGFSSYYYILPYSIKIY